MLVNDVVCKFTSKNIKNILSYSRNDSYSMSHEKTEYVTLKLQTLKRNSVVLENDLIKKRNPSGFTRKLLTKTQRFLTRSCAQDNSVYASYFIDKLLLRLYYSLNTKLHTYRVTKLKNYSFLYKCITLQW